MIKHQFRSILRLWSHQGSCEVLRQARVPWGAHNNGAKKKGEVARGWGRLLVKPTILEKNLENVLISQWLPNAVYTVYKGHIQNSLCFTFRPQHLSCLPLKSSHSLVVAFSWGFFVCKLNLNFSAWTFKRHDAFNIKANEMPGLHQILFISMYI